MGCLFTKHHIDVVVPTPIIIKRKDSEISQVPDIPTPRQEQNSDSDFERSDHDRETSDSECSVWSFKDYCYRERRDSCTDRIFAKQAAEKMSSLYGKIVCDYSKTSEHTKSYKKFVSILRLTDGGVIDDKRSKRSVECDN